MAKTINKCHKCNLYSMKDSCPECGIQIHEEKPAKYSVEDKHGEYRRKAKKQLMNQSN